MEPVIQNPCLDLINACRENNVERLNVLINRNSIMCNNNQPILTAIQFNSEDVFSKIIKYAYENELLKYIVSNDNYNIILAILHNRNINIFTNIINVILMYEESDELIINVDRIVMNYVRTLIRDRTNAHYVELLQSQFILKMSTLTPNCARSLFPEIVNYGIQNSHQPIINFAVQQHFQFSNAQQEYIRTHINPEIFQQVNAQVEPGELEIEDQPVADVMVDNIDIYKSIKLIKYEKLFKKLSKINKLIIQNQYDDATTKQRTMIAMEYITEPHITDNYEFIKKCRENTELNSMEKWDDIIKTDDELYPIGFMLEDDLQPGNDIKLHCISKSFLIRAATSQPMFIYRTENAVYRLPYPMYWISEKSLITILLSKGTIFVLHSPTKHDLGTMLGIGAWHGGHIEDVYEVREYY